MTSAERKAAEASAPPVQTGYYDPNNPGACFDSIVVFQLKTGHKYCIFIWFPTWIMINLMILLKKSYSRSSVCSTPCLLQRPSPGLLWHQRQEKWLSRQLFDLHFCDFSVWRTRCSRQKRCITSAYKCIKFILSIITRKLKYMFTPNQRI